jgi:hypothetical protein
MFHVEHPVSEDAAEAPDGTAWQHHGAGPAPVLDNASANGLRDSRGGGGRRPPRCSRRCSACVVHWAGRTWSVHQPVASRCLSAECEARAPRPMFHVEHLWSDGPIECGTAEVGGHTPSAKQQAMFAACRSSGPTGTCSEHQPAMRQVPQRRVRGTCSAPNVPRGTSTGRGR